MRIAYFDCFSGAAGDMILAALIDAGCPLERLQAVVQRLGLPGVTLCAEKVKRGGIAATHVRVDLGPQPEGSAGVPPANRHRHLSHILRIIEAADFAAVFNNANTADPTTRTSRTSPDTAGAVAERARRIFTRLAEAEATVHASTVESVHFHEVGAADAIVDIVGACAGLALLGIDEVYCSPIPTGHGTLTCEHGVMPIPAPATALLLRGVPLSACEEPGELTTPTGAAILTTLAAGYGPLPPMRIAAVGHGAGTREGRTRPNFLRLIVGEATSAGGAPGGGAEHDRVVVLEAQVDDATGQALGYACQRLLAAGALDAYIVPILMKKGRPGQLVVALCRPDAVAAVEQVLFRETTTFGVRRHECERTKLARERVTVETRFGPIRVKVGRLAGAAVRAWPEYDDCAAAAARTGAPLREVQDAALRAWMLRNDA